MDGLIIVYLGLCAFCLIFILIILGYNYKKISTKAMIVAAVISTILFPTLGTILLIGGIFYCIFGTYFLAKTHEPDYQDKYISAVNPET